jgi:hypothetical protein
MLASLNLQIESGWEAEMKGREAGEIPYQGI